METVSPTLDTGVLRRWIGRSSTRGDTVTAMPVAALAATLDLPEPEEALPGSPLPPLWHWLYFADLTPAHDVGPDGHAHRGEFLPPVALPRRMWAGGRLEFHHPLCIGDEITRTSRIADVSVKSGKSGPLAFVTVRHEIANARGVAVHEEHDIVYREAARPGAPAPAGQPAPSDALFEREIVPDPVLLFRYSALTFNGHRIHYDRSYATGVEGYPGLIVHGPLTATLLADLLRRERPHARLRRFAFRSLRPLFDIHRFAVCGRPEAGERGFALWARDHEGALSMQATAEVM